MGYVLPAHIYDLVRKEFGDEKKADVLLRVIELSFSEIEREVKEEFQEQKEVVKSAVYNELRNELATKEFVRAEATALRDEMHQEIGKLRGEVISLREEMYQEIGKLQDEMHQEIGKLRDEMHQEVSSIRSDIRVLDFQMKVLIALMILGMTLMNPNFVELLRQIFVR